MDVSRDRTAAVIRANSNADHKGRTAQAVIAIVDDEECIRTALGRLMRSAGFTAVTFASGLELVAWAAVNKPDCAVVDLHMPQLDGLQVHAQLLSALQGADVPVIVITGDDSPDICVRAIEQGAYAYLRKPVPHELLVEPS